MSILLWLLGVPISLIIILMILTLSGRRNLRRSGVKARRSFA
jgi:hypothetical protein